MEKTLTVEERLDRIEEVLEKSGLALLARMEVGETLAENLGLLMDPKNLQLVSILARFLDQGEALEKLGIPLEEVWLLAVGDKAVGLDEEVEGPLEVYPPIAGGGILGVLP